MQTKVLTSEPTQQQGIDDLFDAVLNDFSIEFEFDQEDLNHLPKDKPFIVVSNHPLKGIDGILLLKVLSEINPDIKITNDLILPKYLKAQRYFVASNSRQLYQYFHSSIRRKSMEYLKKGIPIGIFPAGSISSPNTESTADPNWSSDNIRFIKSAKVPVVPAYLQLKTNFLPGLKKANNWMIPEKNAEKETKRKITLRIGSPISVEEQNEFLNIDKFGRFLRSKVYCLRSPLEVKPFFKPTLRRESKAKPIAEGPTNAAMLEEVYHLKKDYHLFDSANFSVICAPSEAMPHMIQEIGRQREITFRAVGEGTNRSIDLDEWDLYYYQLFIWDNENMQLVGAYRMGKGKDIIEQYGVKGFYTQSLFRIDEKMAPILGQAVELGRSFIVKDYQRKPLSLFLLWKGILYFLLKNQEYRYLIGPVSISDDYSTASKSLIMNFMKQNFWHEELAKYVHPRKAFKPKVAYDVDILLENTKNSVKRLDSIISDIERSNYKVPVLLKKYLQLNARLLAFNIDPKFNDSLDGMIILDLLDVPYNVIQSLSKEIKDDSILQRFNTLEDKPI